MTKLDLKPSFIAAGCKELYFSSNIEAERLNAPEICAAAEDAIISRLTPEGMTQETMTPDDAEKWCSDPKHHNDPCAPD